MLVVPLHNLHFASTVLPDFIVASRRATVISTAQQCRRWFYLGWSENFMKKSIERLTPGVLMPAAVRTASFESLICLDIETLV